MGNANNGLTSMRGKFIRLCSPPHEAKVVHARGVAGLIGITSNVGSSLMSSRVGPLESDGGFILDAEGCNWKWSPHTRQKISDSWGSVFKADFLRLVAADFALVANFVLTCLGKGPSSDNQQKISPTVSGTDAWPSSSALYASRRTRARAH